MIDIFEILKHEDHNIEIIEHEGKYILGCKSCGKTLLTEDSLKENTREYIGIFTTLKKEDSPLREHIKVFMDKILYLSEGIQNRVVNAVLLKLEELKNRDDMDNIDKVCLRFDIKELLKDVIFKHYDLKTYEKLLESAFTSKEIDLYCLNIKNEVIERLKESLNRASNRYSIHDGNESITISCKEFKCNNYLKDRLFFLINTDLVIEMEKENPTPTDVYTFKDRLDFRDKRPDWDDEEEGNYKFNEFIYRIENNLYNFSNIENGEAVVLFDAVSILSDFDGVERYEIPARKYLEKHFINKGEE